MEMFLNIVPVLGIAALLFAALLAARVSRQNAGTDKTVSYTHLKRAV